MHTRKVGSTLVLAVMVLLSIAGCGKETVPSAAPFVVSTVPANGATGVPVTQVVSATFSVAMNPATLTNSSFTLSGPGGAAVAGTVAYNAGNSTASFTPTASLAYNTLYTATITTAVTDTLGDAPSAATVWTFTTATQPTVLSTIPVNGATSVPVNQVLSATFSKALNPATVNNTTFTLSAGGVAVAGVVTYNPTGSVASFTPTAPLAYNTTFTATLTTGITDTTADPLAANYIWTFTTVARPTVISTVPANGATGVPLTQTISATFSKPVNCATVSAASFTLSGPGATPVTGTVACSGSVATFTPTASLAANTLFTATITTAVTDTTGNPLAANYTWQFRTGAGPTLPTVTATTPANGATAVPINQAISATFSTAMNPATINATTFTLKATAGAAVTGIVTYTAAGSVATFTPTATLLASTAYTATITTGAQDISGNALAANYVWTFTTGAAPDTTRPTVVSTVPAPLATNVPLNQIVSATFSKAMNAATINNSTFTLTGPGATPVAGQVAYASVGTTATFTPTIALIASTLYTATITTAAQDLAGNALAVNYVWTFTTGAVVNTTKPIIVSTIPINGATAVPVNQAISATFSAAMNPLTINTSTFTLTGPGGVAIPATVTYNAATLIATLTPTAFLAVSTTYTATVTSGATDLSGNALGSAGAANPWTFTTGTIALQAPINLGTASIFGGSGGAGITNMGIFTVINGSIATTGVSTTITGFHDNSPGCTYTETTLNMGLVNGSIDTAPPPPTVFCPNEGTAVTQAIAAQAALDTLTAYNALAGIPNGQDVSTCPGCGGGSAGELGNRTLVAGVYKSAAASYTISQGDLTLDAQGNPNAVWVFQAATSLTVGTPSAHRSVLLVNGAQAKNVFWQVGTAATINGILGGGTMSGTVIAQAGISVSTAGVVALTTINGRLLVLTGPLTVVNTVINVPAP